VGKEEIFKHSEKDNKRGEYTLHFLVNLHRKWL
jgi:hypothetical protein